MQVKYLHFSLFSTESFVLLQFYVAFLYHAKSDLKYIYFTGQTTEKTKLKKIFDYNDDTY